MAAEGITGVGQNPPEALDIISQKVFPEFAAHVLRVVAMQNVLSARDQNAVFQLRTG